MYNVIIVCAENENSFYIKETWQDFVNRFPVILVTGDIFIYNGIEFDIIHRIIDETERKITYVLKSR